MTVEERVYECISHNIDITGFPGGVVTKETEVSELGDDLDAEVIDLILELEAEFSIVIPGEVWERFETVGNIIKHIEAIGR